MLDTVLEPIHNLSKNLLLLPWILKLIVDMVNDSIPLARSTYSQIARLNWFYESMLKKIEPLFL